jgi:multiple sugar transport system permease protein
MSARSGDSRRRGDPWQCAGAVFLAVLIVFSLLPMAWMLLTSIKTQFAALQFPPEWIPHNPTLANYIALLSPQADVGREFLRYMVNSLWVSFASTVLGVAVAVPAAYAFSRF